MLAKDCIILVFYVGVGSIHKHDVFEYFENIRNAMSYLRDGSVELIFIPNRETNETRIECINPKLVCEEEYAKALETMKKAEEEIKTYLKSLKDEKE